MEHKSQLDELVTKTYAQLQVIARRIGTEPLGRDLRTTSLIHEAYLRLSKGGPVDFSNEPHFLRIASRAMRNFLMDRARRACALKRGAGKAPQRLFEESTPGKTSHENLTGLDVALTRLREIDPRKSEVVELRFFGGCRVFEVARTLGISKATVVREWDLARAWLHQRLSSPGE